MPRFAPRTGRSVVLKITRKERAATKALRQSLTRRFSDRFFELVRTFRLEASSELRRQAVVSGAVGVPFDAERAFELGLELELSDHVAEAVQRGAISPYRSAISDVAGDAVVQEMQDGMRSWSDRYAAAVVANRVTRVSETTRRSLRQVVRDALADRVDATDAARRISSRVGMTEQQTRTLARFEADLIRRRIPTPEADTQIVRELIAQEVEDRRERLVKRRGEVIAETEIQDAIMAGQRGFWEDVVARGELSPDQIEKRWFTVRDSSVCPICEPLHGETRGFEEPFVSGSFQGQRPVAHPICRCFLEYIVGDGPGVPEIAVRTSSMNRKVGIAAVFALAAGATAAVVASRVRGVREAVQLAEIIPFPVPSPGEESRVRIAAERAGPPEDQRGN